VVRGRGSAWVVEGCAELVVELLDALVDAQIALVVGLVVFRTRAEGGDFVEGAAAEAVQRLSPPSPPMRGCGRGPDRQSGVALGSGAQRIAEYTCAPKLSRALS